MASVIGASTGWWIGLVLGIVVIAVAAAIVIAIVLLARRIARAGARRGRGSRGGARADRRARRDRADQRLRGQDPALGARAAKGGGGQMTTLAVSANTLWAISLGIGLVAALVVAAAPDDPGQDRRRHRQVGRRPARGRRQGRRQHGQHPAARGDRPRAGADRGGSRGPGPLYERPDRRVRRVMSDTDLLVLLSVLLAVVAVAVVAVALIRDPQRPRVGLEEPRHAGRRARDRRVRAPAPARARGQGDQRPVRRHRRRDAGDRRQGRGRCREEAASDPLVDR